jgi:predicted TIM-barrel fold metal-dependent hydrolase
MASHRQGSALLSAVGVAVVLVAPGPSLAQNTGTDVPPVIDVHVHAMDESFPGLGPMCPNTSAFEASDPSTKEAAFGWVSEECTPKLYPSAKGEYLKDVVAEMERLNVTFVVVGDPKNVQKWRDAAPKRVIPGTSFNEGLQPGARVALEELRKAFTKDGFKVMGEIGLQYEGLSPSDPSVDAYFALAEELDVSVIQNADYLTPKQKRDILHDNAARFLRLDAAPAH